MSRIRELREKEGLMQKELAAMADCDQKTISKIEVLGTNSLTIIEKVAKALVVHPSYLCGWSDDVNGTIKVIEKIIEKEVKIPVVAYKDMERIPNYWKTNENGQIIRWMRRGKPV